MAKASDSKATVSARVAMDASNRLTATTATAAATAVVVEAADAPLLPHLWIPSTQPLRMNFQCSLELLILQRLPLPQLCSPRPSSMAAMAATKEVDTGAGTSASEAREEAATAEAAMAAAMVADGELFDMNLVFVICQLKEEERLTQCSSLAITCVNYASKCKSSSYLSVAQL
jgi:hypothetical protein